jgi:iron(III) transport system ATP-binding protein
MAESVTIRSLSKTFASPDAPDKPVHAVREANLEVAPGELVTLLGPSGCGKTTLLRMIAGFEEPSSGEIRFGDRVMNEIAPNRRDAAMVFQSYAIFPHLNVYENVAFGLRLKRPRPPDLTQRVDTVLEMTGLTAMAKRAPSQLSGGQQQRVALARAIVMEPSILLFDEPLSNLDAKLRDQMRVEIRELQQRLGITSLYVTHDQVEAMSISDRIVVMNKGNVEQVGEPADIYARPVSRFVAEFIGKANFLPVRIADAEGVETLGRRFAAHGVGDRPAASAATLLVRPEAFSIAPAGGDKSANGLPGVVKRAMFLGSVAEYLVEVEGIGAVLVDSSNPAWVGLLKVGDAVSITPNDATVLPG